jgi:hypothetical protein
VEQRGVAFSNVFNFRDLGGYRTDDGRLVQWRRLYRSDDLARLSVEDQEAFARLGIRTVVDLRRPEEVASDGRIPAFDGFTYHHVHLIHPYWPRMEFDDTAHRVRYLVERYDELVTDAADGIGQTLRLIADPQTAPLVFHCIAGKDRTGVVAALTLSLLGVPDAAIADDFTLSELAEAAYWDYRRRTDPTITTDRWRHITVSPREGMLAFLDGLRARHGSVAGYAVSVGVTADHVAAMRAHLLTP